MKKISLRHVFSFIVLSLVSIGLIFLLKDYVKLFDEQTFVGLFFLNLINSSGFIFWGIPITIPGLAITFAAGAILNPIMVGIVAGLGSAIGEIPTYFLGGIGKDFAQETEIFKKLKIFVETRGGAAIFLGASVPNPLFDFIGIVSGIIGVPLNKFIAALVLGRIVRGLIVSSLGHFILK